LPGQALLNQPPSDSSRPDLSKLRSDAQPNPLGQTCDEYARATSALPLRPGEAGGVAGAIERYRAFFRRGESHHPYLGPGPRPVSRVHDSDSDEGRVRKFCQTIEPDASGKMYETESVLIPMIGKKRIRTHTLCISSQVGCAMGCTFCQTAQMGKLRDLTPAEIVGQWYAARHLVGDPNAEDAQHARASDESEARVAAGCDSIRNIEPTDNLDNVIKAIAIFTDRSGPNLPMSKITVSTVGNVDGLRRLAAKVHETGWHRLNLAVSLNAPNDEVRSQIMPVNRKWKMGELREAILDWPIYGAAKICFEYVLIPGVNDAREHATQIADFVLGRGEYAGARRRRGAGTTPTNPTDMRGALHGLINLIPYNPRENSPWPAPSEEQADAFLGWLIEEGVFAKRRRTKGRDTMAACGQLGNPALRKRPIPARVSTLSVSARTSSSERDSAREESARS
jgi:23S rRNA (adenine2503-C2)-methyltransferase